MWIQVDSWKSHNEYMAQSLGIDIYIYIYIRLYICISPLTNATSLGAVASNLTDSLRMLVVTLKMKASCWPLLYTGRGITHKFCDKIHIP